MGVVGETDTNREGGGEEKATDGEVDGVHSNVVRLIVLLACRCERDFDGDETVICCCCFLSLLL